MKNSTAILTSMADRWPSEVVARREVGRFTGGGISPKTMANLDSLGEGPRDRYIMGRNVVYPVKSFVVWLQERTKRID